MGILKSSDLICVKYYSNINLELYQTMVSDKALKAIGCRFEAIKNTATDLLNELYSQYHNMLVFTLNPMILTRIGAIVSEYELTLSMYEEIVPEEGRFILERISEDYMKNPIMTLELIRNNCEIAKLFISSLIGNISHEDIDKLYSLRQEIEPLRRSNPKLYQHLENAIEEYENGHYLACALIAGKIFIYCHGSILTGKSEKEKAEILVKKGLLEEKLKESFLRGGRLARNYFSHDVLAYPEPHDSLDLLSQAVKMALIYQKLESELSKD